MILKFEQLLEQLRKNGSDPDVLLDLMDCYEKMYKEAYNDGRQDTLDELTDQEDDDQDK
jgi:hypothetical protein